MENQALIPYLTVADAAKAIDWYAKNFGAAEKQRMKADDGKHLMHAEMNLNGGTLFLADAFPEHGGPPAPNGALPPVGVVINFPKPADVDATFKRAVSAGAKGSVEPRDEFWGARFAVLICPFGHRWVLNAALLKK